MKKTKRKKKTYDVSLAPAKLRQYWSEKSHMAHRQGQMKISLAPIPPPRNPT